MPGPKALIDALLGNCIPEPNSGCWLWLGAVAGGGYGNIRSKGRNIPAHRASWLLFRGPLPGMPLEVCHRCDVRPCVNPDHLFIGTRADNMQDMVSKARNIQVTRPGVLARGERVGTAKLTRQKVIQIRRSPLQQREAAKVFGVGQSQIQRIRAGVSWAHIKDDEAA